MLIRKSQHPTAELSPAVMAIMLSGWGAKPPAGESESDGVFALGGGWGVAGPRDDDGEFGLFEAGADGVVRVWARYKDFLLSEAKRLGIKPACSVRGRRVYFGEYMSAPWQERDPE